MNFQTPRGTLDFLPEKCAERELIEERFRYTFTRWGYAEIRTPTFEYFDALKLGTGDDLIESMFTFEDKGGRLLALRPENTNPVCRVVATKMQHYPKPIKLFYIGPQFRYEEPQSGRQREFWQAGIELIGVNTPEADAEVIAIFIEAFQNIGLKNVRVNVGHIGVFKALVQEAGMSLSDAAELRKSIDKGDLNTLEKELEQLPIQNRLKEAFRLLPSLEGGINVIDQLIPLIDSRDVEAAIKNLRTTVEILGEYSYGEQITINLGIVRGIDYYTGSVFEAFVPELDSSLGGGGRYDTLISEFGGKDTPATGYAIGIDRCHLALEKQNYEFPSPEIRIWVLYLTQEERNIAIQTTISLRRAGFPVILNLEEKGIVAGLKLADKLNIPYVIIIGEKEIKKSEVTVRNMNSGSQESVSLENLIEYFFAKMTK
ncbi:MAG: histidine--tRNA ligase [Promethearchaeota archaeon]